MSSPFQEKITQILETAVGPTVAKSNLEAACKEAGVNAEEISREDLPAISKRLGKILFLMFGPAVCDSVAGQIKNLYEME